VAWYRQTRPDRYTTLGLVNEYVPTTSSQWQGLNSTSRVRKGCERKINKTRN
jgi:hypothetical protein